MAALSGGLGYKVADYPPHSNRTTVKKPSPPNRNDAPLLPPLPDWTLPRREDTPERAAFLSGAALAHLHQVQASPDVPLPLWRGRLALSAALASLDRSGKPKTAADLRDALHFLRPGDLPGPAGEVFRQWSRLVERPLSAAALQRALPQQDAETPALALAPAELDPVAHAAGVISRVLVDAPRATTEAVMLADAALARSLGWRHVVPVLALGLQRADLRKEGEDMRLACYRALVAAVRRAVQEAQELSLRAARLQATLPRLRAKAAGKALDVMLAQDALAPTALTGLMSDRAARRLCDRLVVLGVLRELTGRDSFRLYGV